MVIEKESLGQLIKNYYSIKSEASDYEKIAKEFNKEIKDRMNDTDLTEFKEGNYSAKLVTTEKTTMNEPVLLEVLKNNQIHIPEGIIKVKEYVDYEALESSIYTGEIPIDIVKEINEKCMVTKSTQTLRVTYKKEDTSNE